MTPKNTTITGIQYGWRIDFIKKSKKTAIQQATISIVIHAIQRTGIFMRCLFSSHIPVKYITTYSKINSSEETINMVHIL